MPAAASHSPKERFPGPCAVNKRNFLKVVEIPLPQYQKNGRKLLKKHEINEDDGKRPNQSCINGESGQKTQRNKDHGIETARRYLRIMEDERLESRADLARHLNVSRARVAQVLNRLKNADF